MYQCRGVCPNTLCKCMEQDAKLPASIHYVTWCNAWQLRGWLSVFRGSCSTTSTPPFSSLSIGSQGQCVGLGQSSTVSASGVTRPVEHGFHVHKACLGIGSKLAHLQDLAGSLGLRVPPLGAKLLADWLSRNQDGVDPGTFPSAGA